MRNAAQRTELRIVHQGRTVHGRTYHLACNDHRLLLDFSSADDEGNDGTLVATGRERAFSNDVSLTAQAPTRTEALREVARIWREDSLKYPSFDWDAIESALREVKAL